MVVIHVGLSVLVARSVEYEKWVLWSSRS